MPKETIKSPNEMNLAPASSQVSSTMFESKEESRDCFPSDVHENLPHLPPKDEGKAAWLFLAAAFVVEVLTFGQCCIYSCTITHLLTDFRI